MLCAGEKGKGACDGDTGGPLVDSGNYLVGVVSWGNACSDTGYIGVYTEVSYFVDWINETMSQIRKTGKGRYNWSVKVDSSVEHT